MTSKIKETSALVQAPPIQNGFSLISNEKLLQLYSTMLKCRMLAENSHILLKVNKLNEKKSVQVGHEAAIVGVSIDLLPEDTIAPAPSDTIQLFVNKLPPVTPFGERLQPIASSSGIVARLKVATDAAMLNKLTSNSKIAVAICNDSTSLRPWQKALSLAGLHDLPMIFVSWNHPPSKTKAFSFPAITVDGNDVVAVYRVACEAIAHARKGNGPTLIECQTGHRNPGDPILNMEKYLAGKGLFSEDFRMQQSSNFNRELEATSESARNSA
jgi:TPP-dependent pyruvate/acetoin dehydrogenase alpha subunit